jgi:hypothetical protein
VSAQDSKGTLFNMGTYFNKAALLSVSLAFSVKVLATSLQCEKKYFTLKVLGSGGQITDDQRASSEEVIWINGKSAILIDAGGGIFLRFGQAGTRLEDLKLIALSHFHIDHVSDLTAILKGGYFLNDKKDIDLVGPESGGAFPSMTEYLSDLLKKEHGAYSYLNGLYNAIDGLVKPGQFRRCLIILSVIAIASGATVPVIVLAWSNLKTKTSLRHVSTIHG